jgi:hypothetical protein
MWKGREKALLLEQVQDVLKKGGHESEDHGLLKGPKT